MTPTMEEVAGLLRQAADNHRISASFAGTASGALMHRAKEKVYRDLAAQVEAMGWRPIHPHTMRKGWLNRRNLAIVGADSRTSYLKVEYRHYC